MQLSGVLALHCRVDIKEIFVRMEMQFDGGNRGWLHGFLSSTQLSSSTSSEQPIACRTSSWSLFMWHSPSSIPHFGSQEIVFVDLATHKINSVGWNQKGLVRPASLHPQRLFNISPSSRRVFEKITQSEKGSKEGGERGVLTLSFYLPPSLSLIPNILLISSRKIYAVDHEVSLMFF